MRLEFVHAYGGRRFTIYAPQPPLWGDPADAEDAQDEADLDYELPRDAWEALDPDLPDSWRPGDWPERPLRFVDGKDVGETVTCLTAPGGYPVPVRLSEIGGVVVRVEDGVCRREWSDIERVVTLVGDVFPAGEVGSFGAALQSAGMRLALAEPPEGGPSYDLERMRKAAQNRSNVEMSVLEDFALGANPDVPTVVDGRLEPRAGAFDPATSPVFGVVKTHRKNYLHPWGMQLLYRLQPGQRTPAFRLEDEKLPVVSWYVRLAGGPGTMPNWGIVRVEASLRWFEDGGPDWRIVDRLSRALFAWRCRETSYGRAPVSLHPIVRAEELLGALFTPTTLLASRFYRLAGL
jgi:hypothetical protein